jgi:SAM dependent carboxyl methyltransferase
MGQTWREKGSAEVVMIGKSMPGSGAMEGGGAYNRHATIPAQGAAFALPYLEAAARAVSFDRENGPVVIADYGSSEGRNSLAPMRIAIDVFRSHFGPGRPIVVCHTDLPVNDFRTLFALLENDPERYLLNDKRVFPCVIGRSFYQSVLPPAHVHLGWSSYAAMWISQIPPVQPDHVFVPRMTGVARFELERQAAKDWATFLTLRAAELRSGGRLVVVLPAARDDGSSGFETIMDHAYDVLGEMVRDGAISSNERGRMVLGVWPRRRCDLLAPFQGNKQYRDLTIESCETSELMDPAWTGYELGGDREALAIRHAAF